MVMHLEGLSNRELLRLHYAVLAHLRTNGVVRSSNSPIGDYAELLVQRAYGGTLPAEGNPGWDVDTPNLGRVQVKARIRTAAEIRNGQWGPVMPDSFDVCVYVWFEPTTVELSRAVLLPAATIVKSGNPHKGGFRFPLRVDLLSLPAAVDVTGDLANFQET